MQELDTNIIIFAGFIVSFVITYISIPSIIRVAELKHLFDEPDERTVHTKNIATLGGVAIFAGITISLLLFINAVDFPEIKYIVAAIIVMFFIGIKDDILVIAPLTKLFGQVFAALIITSFTDIKITNLHYFFGITNIPEFVSIPLTVFVIIVIINGFNLIDGVDGLSASITIITSLSLGVWFYLTGHYQLVIVSAVIIGALLAFLRFNLFASKEKIFMGDTGSLILGLLSSVLIIKFNEINTVHSFKYTIWGAPATSFAIFIIPLFDTIRVMFIRFMQKKSMFRPDKQHIHHLLLQHTRSHGAVVLILLTINLIFIITAYLISNIFGIRTLLLIYFLMAMVIFYIPVYILERKKKNRQNIKSN